MNLMLFAATYSSTPRPPSIHHVHPTFQRVCIAWACEDIPGWYFVHPACPESAPILHRQGWYVHHSDLCLIVEV